MMMPLAVSKPSCRARANDRPRRCPACTRMYRLRAVTQEIMTRDCLMQ
jgi:hypothetical protein